MRHLLSLTSLLLVSTFTSAHASYTNQVLALDGISAQVSVPSASTLQNSNAITIEAWIYATRPQNNLGSFIMKGDGLIYYSARSYEIDWFTNDSGEGVAADLFLNTTTWAHLWAFLPETNWVHVAVTYSSTNGLFQLYTNGVLASYTYTNVSGVPLAGQLLRQTTLPLNLGGQTIPGYSPVFAAGYMDEVSIWNTPRTPAEIAGTMFSRLSGNESNLMGYWNFDDGTATDLTGNGHDGTLEGSAQIVPIIGSDVVHGGPPRTATAIAILNNGFVVSNSITDGGAGYTNTPNVRIIGGGGSGAQAFATVTDGVVTSITVTSAGNGYTSTPLVVIDPPFIPNPVLDIAPLSFLVFSNLTVGSAYQLQQSVAWYWTNQPLSFTATNSLFYLQLFGGEASSAEYRLALTPVPAQAFAMAVVSYGIVTHATVTSGGSGYLTSPAVTIVGGGGTNATAVAQISSGAVTNLTITSYGSGYTNTPAVQIAPPPAAAVSPTVLPVMRLDSASLAPYDNYQIEFTPALGEAWGNWNGGLFSPTDVTNSQYLFITNGTGFFRLLYVP